MLSQSLDGTVPAPSFHGRNNLHFFARGLTCVISNPDTTHVISKLPQGSEKSHDLLSRL